jgi:hypothetical protein
VVLTMGFFSSSSSSVLSSSSSSVSSSPSLAMSQGSSTALMSKRETLVGGGRYTSATATSAPALGLEPMQPMAFDLLFVAVEDAGVCKLLQSVLT